MNDVLVIRFSSLGDVVMASAVFEALHKYFPGIRIHFLTKSVYVPLFESDDRITKVVGINGRESPFQIASMIGRRTFDAVLDLHGSLRSTSVVSLLKAPLKSRVNKHVWARRIMVWSRNRFRRTFDVLGNYLDTLAPLGITGRFFPRLVPSEKNLEAADNLLKENAGCIVGFAPGSRHTAKRWNENSFAQLADKFAQRGDMPVFIGDMNDIEVIERIRKSMSSKSLSLAGKTDLAVTAGVISRCKALVTNDSGPMHIAGALSVPFSAIFGPTHPVLGFVPGYPYGIILHSGVHCSPCSIHGEKPCRMGKMVCMDKVTWEMVMAELDKVSR